MMQQKKKKFTVCSIRKGQKCIPGAILWIRFIDMAHLHFYLILHTDWCGLQTYHCMTVRTLCLKWKCSKTSICREDKLYEYRNNIWLISIESLLYD
jgi:hypothetical protein